MEFDFLGEIGENRVPSGLLMNEMGYKAASLLNEMEYFPIPQHFTQYSPVGCYSFNITEKKTSQTNKAQQHSLFNISVFLLNCQNKLDPLILLDKLY